MIAKTKKNTRPQKANLQQIDQPFYGLKSYKAELGKPTHAAKRKSSSAIKVPRFSPWKIIMVTMGIGIAGFFYLTHVFATQTILKEVTELRNAHESAKRSHAENSLAYDRMTGPAQIYEKARNQGYIHGEGADPIIRINK